MQINVSELQVFFSQFEISKQKQDSKSKNKEDFIICFIWRIAAFQPYSINSYGFVYTSETIGHSTEKCDKIWCNTEFMKFSVSTLRDSTALGLNVRTLELD